MATLVVYADASNKHLYSSAGNLVASRSGIGTLEVHDGVLVGQTWTATIQFFEPMLWWDTSPLTADATVPDAVASFYGKTNGVGTNFTCNLRLCEFGDTVGTADFVGGDSLSGHTLLAHAALTAGTPVNAYTDFTSDALAANINTTGHTRALLCTSRQEASLISAAESMLWEPGAGAGASPEPKLTITYTLPSPPTVTGVSPSNGPMTGGTSVVIAGTDLTGASAVAFENNGNWSTPAAGYHVDSATQITAVAPSVVEPATVDVRVTTAGGTSATGAADHFTFANPVVFGPRIRQVMSIDRNMAIGSL